MIIIFSNILNLSIDVFFKENVIVSLENSMNLLKETVEKFKSQSQYAVERLIKKKWIDYSEYTITYSADNINQFMKTFGLDYVFLYNSNQLVTNFYNIKKHTERHTGLDVSRHLSMLQDEEDIYSTYEINENYILTIKKIKNGKTYEKTGYVCGVMLMSSDFSSRALDLVNAVRRIKQFQLLKKPLKGSLFFIYLYFYIPVLSLGLLLFHYNASKIVSPLGKLDMATQLISKGDFTFHIPYKGKDEVGRLINSFNNMAKELLYNRIEIKRMSHIQAWRDVAVRLAHEMKNPLTPIQLAAEKIEKSVIDNDFYLYSNLVDSFNVIYSEVTAVKNLVADFQNMAKDITIKIKRVRVNSILEKVESHLKQLENIQYFISIKHGPRLRINLDKQRIEQVLLNILKNAIESIHSANKQDGMIKVVSKLIEGKANSQYQIDIEDNGPGISEGIKNNLFEPYFTTKKEGTGLGLPICERIIFAHKGKILFNSKKGKTVFTILLPAS
jgi:nitrogen fixation/metabolism regulation signal transduction histidine kinase